MSKIICCSSSGLTLYQSIPSWSLILWLTVSSVHIPYVTWSRAQAFHWEQTPLSRVERQQQLFPALLCFLTPAPQLYTLTATRVGSLHLLGSYRVECSQTKQKYVSLWVLPMCVGTAVVNNAQSSIFFLFCTWDNWCKTCLISLHLGVPLVLHPRQQRSLPCEEQQLPEGHASQPGSRGKAWRGVQKGLMLQLSGETETWKVTHLSTGRRRMRIRTVRWLQ